jgi:hypothetical protein
LLRGCLLSHNKWLAPLLALPQNFLICGQASIRVKATSQILNETMGQQL